LADLQQKKRKEKEKEKIGAFFAINAQQFIELTTS